MFRRIINFCRRKFYTNEKYARSLGVKIGRNCSKALIHFGSESYLKENRYYVQITNEVRFYTHGGGWVLREKYPKMDSLGKIKIGNNVYIGNAALILSGAAIEDNCIIGAGTVVTKSVPTNSIVAGNPGRIIGAVDELEKKMVKYNLNTKGMSYKEKKSYLLSLDPSRFISK